MDHPRSSPPLWLTAALVVLLWVVLVVVGWVWK